jgi:hypothetical protein
MSYLSYSSALILKTSQSQPLDAWEKKYDQNGKWKKKKKKEGPDDKIPNHHYIGQYVVVFCTAVVRKHAEKRNADM